VAFKYVFLGATETNALIGCIYSSLLYSCGTTLRNIFGESIMHVYLISICICVVHSYVCVVLYSTNHLKAIGMMGYFCITLNLKIYAVLILQHDFMVVCTIYTQ